MWKFAGPCVARVANAWFTGGRPVFAGPLAGRALLRIRDKG